MKTSELEECVTQQEDAEEIYNNNKSVMNNKEVIKGCSPIYAKCLSLKQQRNSQKRRLFFPSFVENHRSNSHTANIPSEGFPL